MVRPNSRASLRDDLQNLGIEQGSTLMVHSSLRQVGWTIGGAMSVVHALVDVLGDSGTLVMPAESPSCADPAEWNETVPEEWLSDIRQHLPLFDPATTPTTMGAIAEAFRTFPGTVRSSHPTVSVCANGPFADRIVAEHPLAFCEGPGSPFETMCDLGAHTLLLGVGFDRCTFLHYAESLSPHRRTMTNRLLIERAGEREWVEVPNMATDGGTLFLPAGDFFLASHPVTTGDIGQATAMLFPARELVDSTQSFFEQALAP